jgi:hypothetical protein
MLSASLRLCGWDVACMRRSYPSWNKFNKILRTSLRPCTCFASLAQTSSKPCVPSCSTSPFQDVGILSQQPPRPPQVQLQPQRQPFRSRHLACPRFILSSRSIVKWWQCGLKSTVKKSLLWLALLSSTGTAACYWTHMSSQMQRYAEEGFSKVACLSESVRFLSVGIIS